MPFHTVIDEPRDAAHALASTAVAWDLARAQTGPSAILYAAPLTGRAVVLGRWQRRESALRDDAVGAMPVLRRATGGPTALAQEGVIYVSLSLRHASVLMDCPPDRVLNRNVRGMLGALSEGGLPAHYFGREWITLAHRPVALVGWTRGSDGAVLLEFFIAHQKSFVPDASLVGYPERDAPMFMGKTPITLDEAFGTPVDETTVLSWLAPGHAQRYRKATPVESPLIGEFRERAKLVANEREMSDEPVQSSQALVWSAPKEVPVGFVEAGLGLDANGNVDAVAVAGDFFQDEDAEEALLERLRGRPAAPELFASAVNETYDGVKHVIDGLKELQPILAALTDAHERASA